MGALETLLSQYSIESIIILLCLVAAAIKVVSDLWDWGYGKIKARFNIKTEQQQQDEEDRKAIQRLEESFTAFVDKSNENDENLASQIAILADNQKMTTDRLQENTRSFIIDKHHYFCYKVKAIDDMNLQSLERRYMYYKSAGGDSFVDQLMEDIRELPRVNLQNRMQGKEIERDEIM